MSDQDIHFHKPYEGCYDDCPEPHSTKEEAEERERQAFLAELRELRTPDRLRREAEKYEKSARIMREDADKIERGELDPAAGFVYG